MKAVSQRQDDSALTTHPRMFTLVLFEVVSPAQVRQFRKPFGVIHPAKQPDRLKKERERQIRRERLIEKL